MKKSMVLVISIFFIAAISVLILKNLSETNSYLKEQNYKFNKAQIFASLNNVQNEVSNIIKNNNDYVSLIEDKVIPLKVKDVNITFSLNSYDKIDINFLNSNNTDEYKKLKNIFNDNDVTDFEVFKEIYLEKRKEYSIIKKVNNNNVNTFRVNSSKQMDDIISIFINKTYSKEILKIKEKLGFLLKPLNSSFYELKVNVNYLNDLIKANYILNEKGEVKYFEFSFK